MNKSYLISFIYQQVNQKMVVTGLTQVEMATKKLTPAIIGTKNSTDTLGGSMLVLAKRALMVIPVWLALRAIFMIVMGTITAMIKAHLDLEEGMARIRTVVTASSTTIEADMGRIKSSIMDMAVKTRVSIKELAEVFYFLRTANLSTIEAMALFEPTVNAMVGTMNTGKDTARAMAGMYNTMAESLGDNLTVQEKAIKIGDILTYTYATQDVQLSELIEGYTKIAPYLTGLSDSFEEIVTVLGVLNTNLLRSGRTGRLLGRTILQIVKNSKQLAQEFGIMLDPDQPVSLLKVLKALHDQMASTTAMTAGQQKAMQAVFATRGGIAPRILIRVWEDLEASLDGVSVSAEGFAEKMREIREETTRAQFARMANILGVLFEAFIQGATAGHGFAKTLQSINDDAANTVPEVTALGDAIGYFIYMAEGAKRAALDFTRNIANLIPGVNLPTTKDVFGEHKYFRSDVGYMAKTQETAEATKQRQKVRESLSPERKKEFDLVQLNGLKKEQQITKQTTAIMKAQGVAALEIARYKLDMFENERIYITDVLEEALELEKRQAEVMKEQVKYKQEMVRNLQTAQLQNLNAMGVSQLRVLEYQKQQIEANRAIAGQAATEALLARNSLQITIAKTNEMRKQKDLLGNFATLMHNASETEKVDVDRIMEMREWEPEEIVNAISVSGFDKKVVDDYYDYLKKAQQEAVDAYRAGIYNMREVSVDEGAEVPKGWKEDFTYEVPNDFWRNWLDGGKVAVENFREKFKWLIGYLGPEGMAKGPESLTKTPLDDSKRLTPAQMESAKAFYRNPADVKPSVLVPVTVENMNINLNLEDITEKTSEALKKAIMEDERFQKAFIDKNREKI